jgi:ABC-type transport system involved in multi-copper enzyme maturation permease subunit
MTASLGRIWAIALNTFREAARIKVLYAIVVVVVGVNLLAIALGEMSISQQTRVARDFGITGISLFGSLTAIFVGIVLLYGEIQRRTIYSIISKPLARWEFVVGKYLGMVLVLTVLVALFAAAMAALLAYQGVAVSGPIAKALVLAWFEVLTVAAIAVFFSSFSSPFLSGTFALALWAIGRVTPDLRAAIASSESTWIKWVAKGALVIVPDLHVFSISGGDVDGQHVSVNGGFVDWGYVAAAAAHGALWIAALLVLACAIFRKRDFV